MAQGIWINTVQQLTAAAAGIKVVIHHFIHPLDRQQFRPTAGMALLSIPLAATALAPLWRINPSPSLERGLEELRELRPIRSRRFSNSVAKEVSWPRNSSICCCWALISALTLAGDSSQSASGIPARSGFITGCLHLRCNRKSNCRQGFSRADVRRELSRTMNGYERHDIQLPYICKNMLIQHN